MIWHRVGKRDPRALELADRHYNRQKHGSGQFMPPGRTVVLLVPGLAVWGSLLQVNPRHRWKRAWVCSIFRNEGAGLSSDLIRQAIAATRFEWRDVPDEQGLAMITFVAPSQVRRKRDPGRCYLRAGFEVIGETEGAEEHGRETLTVLGLRRELVPDPLEAPREQLTLWRAA